MIAYIQKIAEDLKARFEWPDKSEELHDFAINTLNEHLEMLVEELNRLDPRDFVGDERYEFVELRRMVRGLTRDPAGSWSRLYADWDKDERERKEVARALDEANKNGAEPRDFPDLRERLLLLSSACKIHSDRFERAAEICARVVKCLWCAVAARTLSSGSSCSCLPLLLHLALHAPVLPSCACSRRRGRRPFLLVQFVAQREKEGATSPSA